jgi:hypothetical protein
MHGKSKVCLKIHYIMIGKRVGSYFKSSAINLEISTNLIQRALASPSSKLPPKYKKAPSRCFFTIPIAPGVLSHSSCSQTRVLPGLPSQADRPR